MADDATGRNAPTRREYVKYGGAVVSGGLFAGCAGDGGSASTEGDATDAPTGTERETATDSSYSVTMEPMGEVTFDAVPERWMSYFSTYGDMAIALGRIDGLGGLVFTENWPLPSTTRSPAWTSPSTACPS